MPEFVQSGLSMMSESIHTFFVLVDPHPFFCIKMVWTDQNKKGWGSTKTTLTVQAVGFQTMVILVTSRIWYNCYVGAVGVTFYSNPAQHTVYSQLK